MNTDPQPKSDRDGSTRKDRVSILEQIRNPLVFSALALLIIEGALGIVVGVSGLESQYKFYTICIMAGLFLIVFIAVMIITFMRPTHLYEDISKDLEHLKAFVKSSGLEDLIEDTIVNRIKPECIEEQQEEVDSHGEV